MFKAVFLAVAIFASEDEGLDFDIEDDEPAQPVRRRREKPKNDESAAAEVDAQLSEAQRGIRMKACLDISRAKLAANDAVVSEYVTKLTSGLVGAELSAQQALEYVNMDFVKNCYLSIDQAADIPAFKNNPAAWRAANENRVLLPDESRSHIRTLHQRQWDLLKTILKKEETQKKNPGKAQIEAAPTATVVQLMYLIAILAAVFGLGYWLLLQLAKADASHAGKREAKKAKNA